MRILLLIGASIALSACQSRDISASANEAPGANPKSEVSEKSKADAGVIVLDQVEQQKAHVVVEPVRLKDVGASLTVPGRLTVSEDQTWRVGAIASGRIDDISARVGDSANAGQILGHIHSHEVHEARAGYQQAIAEVERAKSAEGYAIQRRDRAQRLLELRAGSRQDLETAEADVRSAHAAIEKAQSELEKERAHLSIFQIADSEDDAIPILAPASGLVLERKATVGSVVNAGDELFVLTDTSGLWMIAAANEEDLSKLRPGQAVRVQVRAYPGREFAGRILKLGEKLDAATRTLQVRILVPNPQGLLKPEMYAAASLHVSGRRSVVFLPEDAIQDIDGVPAVFVRRAQNEFEVRTLKTGEHLDGAVEILQGLNPGEAVAVKGSFLLKSQLLRNMIQDQ
jgi:cobalt-zinc-cadmium efflux system membrane fusion protein